MIGVGVIVGPDLEQLAREFPDVEVRRHRLLAGAEFAGAAEPRRHRFREQEGSFLVGAIAALVSRTHVVGVRRRHEDSADPQVRGRLHGRRTLRVPDVRVLAVYAGTEPKAFNDAPRGQELGAALYDEGADIIFTAAGKTGDGVFAVARSRGLYAIGVDSDQYDMAPCCIVTSMLKRVDLAVVDVVTRRRAGTASSGGMRELGLAEKRVGVRRRRAQPPAVAARRGRARAGPRRSRSSPARSRCRTQ